MFDIKDGTLVKYTGEESRVVIPPNVTKIGCKAFGDNKIIEAVYIPDSVECIEYSTFEYCSNLKVISYNAKYSISFLLLLFIFKASKIKT